MLNYQNSRALTQKAQNDCQNREKTDAHEAFLLTQLLGQTNDQSAVVDYLFNSSSFVFSSALTVQFMKTSITQRLNNASYLFLKTRYVLLLHKQHWLPK